MAVTFQTCLDFVLRQEGGWSDNPADPGGATNHGITLNTYRTFIGDRLATRQDLRDISMDDVAAIYHCYFWREADCDSLPAGLDLMVFDMAVNCGARRSICMLQKVINVYQDGLIGPATMHALAEADLLQTLGRLKMVQQEYYQALNNPVFIKGWLNRLDARHQKALSMLEEWLS